MAAIPTLREGDTVLRPIRVRDARALERELIANRPWLRPWEATSPGANLAWDTKGSIRGLLQQARAGSGLPFVIECDGQFAGQLNVSQITYGSLASATLGYWVAERFAGRGLTPTAVALATDHLFFSVGLHRMEICIRPENAPSLRVVEKLGFRYEGLRRRFIHIDGDWRDHFCFALTVEEVPVGVLQRWKQGRAPEHAAQVSEVDRIAARRGLRLP
jgi:[ribosomal protein S5]-alanine N-acetyltransferase